MLQRTSIPQHVAGAARRTARAPRAALSSRSSMPPTPTAGSPCRRRQHHAPHAPDQHHMAGPPAAPAGANREGRGDVEEARVALEQATPLLEGQQGSAGGAAAGSAAAGASSSSSSSSRDGSRDGSHGSSAGVDWVATGLCFAFPALASGLFGYDIGASSGVLASLSSPTLSGTDWYALSPFQSGLVVSMSLVGAVTGSLLALVSGNRLGRRSELLLAAGLYGGGALLLGVAPSLTVLLLARVMYGLGIGFAMHAAPAYIAETSPPSVRGTLISLKEAVIVGGILAGYAAGYAFVGDVGGWRSMYGVAAPAAALLGLGMAALPESPRWLLLSGAGRDAALRALVRAEGRRARANMAAVAAEVDGMAASLAASSGSGGDGASGAAGAAAAAGTAGSSVLSALGLSLFREQRYVRPLLVGMSLMLFQQITGQPSVLYYAAQIFERAGFAGGQEAAGVSVLLGAFKLVMTLVAVATVDKLGRRPLLLGGVSGMVVALLLLTAAQGGVEVAAAAGGAAGAGGGGVSAAWVSAAALLLYVGCYQVSFGPISWLIVGEVFPLAVRSQALALATFVNFASNAGVSLVLPSLQDGIGMQATYALFAAVGVAAVANIWFNVPETKGKTLEEIEQLWKK